MTTHPYRLPMIGTRESVAPLRCREPCAARHTQVACRAQTSWSAVSGDVDPDAIAQALSVRLEGLAHGRTFVELDPAERRCLARTKSGEVSLRKERAQTHLAIGIPRPHGVRPRPSTALEVIAQVMAGQGGRLFLELRDRRGLAYAVSASQHRGRGSGPLRGLHRHCARRRPRTPRWRACKKKLESASSKRATHG